MQVQQIWDDAMAECNEWMEAMEQAHEAEICALAAEVAELKAQVGAKPRAATPRQCGFIYFSSTFASVPFFRFESTSCRFIASNELLCVLASLYVCVYRSCSVAGCFGWEVVSTGTKVYVLFLKRKPRTNHNIYVQEYSACGVQRNIDTLSDVAHPMHITEVFITHHLSCRRGTVISCFPVVCT